jgi:hypothetical protein
LKLESVLLQRIIDAQRTDKGIKYIHEKMEADRANCFRKDDQGVIWFKDRIVVPKDAEVRQQILDEAHLSRYSIHLGSTKMFQDLKQRYWCTKMKIEITRYVAKCEDINMDFIVGLPKTAKGFDSIWVIIAGLQRQHIFFMLKWIT